MDYASRRISCEFNTMTPEYRAWAGMKYRCNNPNCKEYYRYGGRGIRVCERWNDFSNFFTVTMSPVTVPGNPGMSKSCGPNKQRMFIAMDSQGTMIASDNQCEFARQHKLCSPTISAGLEIYLEFNV